MVRNATATDETLQKSIGLINCGFPPDNRTLPWNLRLFSPYSASLYTLDGVVMLSDQIVIPAALRHAAHQSIDRMKARASESVFWPGIVGDITKVRLECVECNKMAKSNLRLRLHPTHQQNPNTLSSKSQLIIFILGARTMSWWLIGTPIGLKN